MFRHSMLTGTILRGTKLSHNQHHNGTELTDIGASIAKGTHRRTDGLNVAETICIPEGMREDIYSQIQPPWLTLPDDQ